MIQSFDKILDLIKKTGDKVIIASENSDPFVMLPFGEYEHIIDSRDDFSQMSEKDILNKINRDISLWKQTRLGTDAEPFLEDFDKHNDHQISDFEADDFEAEDFDLDDDYNPEGDDDGDDDFLKNKWADDLDENVLDELTDEEIHDKTDGDVKLSYETVPPPPDLLRHNSHDLEVLSTIEIEDEDERFAEEQENDFMVEPIE